MIYITQEEFRRRENRKAFIRNAFVVVPMICAFASLVLGCMYANGFRL